MAPWLEPWLQFGLGGTVIGALFFILYTSLRFIIKEHRKEREHADKNHREERTDWKDAMSKIADRSDQTAREISERFADLHKETLDALRDK